MNPRATSTRRHGPVSPPDGGARLPRTRDRPSGPRATTVCPVLRTTAKSYWKATSAGMHAGTLTFTASTAGTYHYLCPVPGHAQKGMVGTFQVG